MNNNAQIALKNKSNWMVIGPGWSEAGSLVGRPMPKVDCPIVETTSADQKLAEKTVRKFTSDAGASDVDRLITELLAIGSTLVIPVDIHEFNITMNAAV